MYGLYSTLFRRDGNRRVALLTLFSNVNLNFEKNDYQRKSIYTNWNNATRA